MSSYRVILLVTAVASLLAVAGCGDDGHSAAADLEPGSIHDLFDETGRLAYPAPRLAEGVSVQPADGGGATLRFAIAYATANRATSAGVVSDRAEIFVRVAPEAFNTGPRPDVDVFSHWLADEEIDDGGGVRRYEVTLPANVVDFLREEGIESGDPDERAAARQLISVRVQQARDFQLVDGRHDWFHGTTFHGAQSPTVPAENPGGALTIRNDTASGIYDVNYAGLEPVPQLYGQGLFPRLSQYSRANPESPGVTLALAGQAVSCFYQDKDGSNPQGFTQNLAPGDAVTQTIVADDSKYHLPNDSTMAAAAANAIVYSLRAGVFAINQVSRMVFGGPFTVFITLPVKLLETGENCNNQPNLFQIGVVSETGEASNSTTWSAYDNCGGTCGGLANYYSTPLRSSAPTSSADVIKNAVQLAPDSTHRYEGQPLWIAQVPIQGCGVGNASDSNVSGCTSQNLISLRWTTSPACPWTNGFREYNGSVVGDVSWCFEATPPSPEVPACGTNNGQCDTYSP